MVCCCKSCFNCINNCINSFMEQTIEQFKPIEIKDFAIIKDIQKEIFENCNIERNKRASNLLHKVRNY